MTIQFLGAAQTVTGSMHLITTDNGSRILLDCGLYQGRRSEAYLINKKLPFDPDSLDSVVVSHAHIDHTGNLPQLVKNQWHDRYTADIHCTHATRDLCAIMLPDSAFIQQSDAEFLHKHNRAHADPLYTIEDARAVLKQFTSHPYNKQFRVAKDVVCTFFDAGHILGSAAVLLEIEEGGQTKRLCFTGDVGRPNRPLMNPPEVLGQQVDVLISESTYGGRTHPSSGDVEEILRQTIQRTVDRGGKVIIPAFAVERTQDIVFQLNNMFNDGRLPKVPIYVDSPLAMNATDIFRTHPECFNDAVTEVMRTDSDPFGFDTLHYIRSADESRALNHHKEPCVIISASGMMEAGRVQHHLRNNVEDERNTIMVIGFQAEHTLGRRIVEGVSPLRIMGDEFELKAEVKVINGLSAHADHGELMQYISQFHTDVLKKICLVHGESKAQTALQTALHEAGYRDVIIPAKYETVYV